jgi:hypothetical protein
MERLGGENIGQNESIRRVALASAVGSTIERYDFAQLGEEWQAGKLHDLSETFGQEWAPRGGSPVVGRPPHDRPFIALRSVSASLSGGSLQ